GAAPSPELTVEELLRQGNAAFSAGDYAAAVKAFSSVEDLTDDPGQAAFNKAAALYRQALQADVRQRTGLLREAAESARHWLAAGRRWAAIFGMGNSLLQQQSAGNPRVLFDAIACYEQVLAGDAEPQLKEDARHNLELAKLLWAQAHTPTENNDSKPPNDPDN